MQGSGVLYGKKYRGEWEARMDHEWICAVWTNNMYTRASSFWCATKVPKAVNKAADKLKPWVIQPADVQPAPLAEAPVKP